MKWFYFIASFCLALLILFVASCSKDGGPETFIVSAKKMITITSHDWNDSEALLKDKAGYQYTKAADNLSAVLKAVVNLPAIDDSNRSVNGSMLLNIAPDNRVFYAAFDSEPLEKAAAFAMFLEYHNESLQSFSSISASLGDVVQNGIGGNTTVAEVLSKISIGEEASQLGIMYETPEGRYSMIVFRQGDGRYIFSYRGNR